MGPNAEDEASAYFRYLGSQELFDPSFLSKVWESLSSPSLLQSSDYVIQQWSCYTKTLQNVVIKTCTMFVLNQHLCIPQKYWPHWPWRGAGPGTLLLHWTPRWPPGTLGWRHRRSCPRLLWTHECHRSPAQPLPSGQRRGEIYSAARCCDSWLEWGEEGRLEDVRMRKRRGGNEGRREGYKGIEIPEVRHFKH